ncbi:MADS-box domain-containing protein [Mycena venus]|uniref:MADS-box domain-containing protein n=1 Tax=Mycena venus TaxID=2733690 RepID=A0A8H6YVL2_9AGAR|nr:MADS-box domain-containing protein [Mycena venus]
MSDLVENGARSPVASDSDPASSLRAAALLTLKSKRRKPVVDTSGASGLSQRPPPADTSVQLDYGQDDISSSPTDVAMPPAQLKLDPEDGQLREEGEISDSEDAPIRDPPHPGPSSPVPPRECIIDADHVRPGLSMNQGQYDTAKDIVLDLLGWGVPPDYLVDCNLSREIVFYVFSELNLRLPHNLDTTGLIPYTPAHVALYSRPLSATPSSRPEAPPSSRPLHGHPSLPPKPLAGSNAVSGPQQRSTVPPPSPPHTSSPPIAPSPTNQHSSATGSLHDMERQRRQELLARKAVQASRKIKPPSDASSIASSSHAPDPTDQSGVQDQDVEMTPAVATEAPEPPESANSMDVDEIPGLGGSYRNAGSASSFYGTVPDSQMPAYTDQVVISPAELSFSAPPPHPAPQSDPPPSSGESGSTTFALEQNSYDAEQLSHHHQGLQRRGSKRPTAADFVDFDPGSRNGYNNGSMPHPLKRKTASFASVSGHRKLVIDLSDSEGEGGEDFVMHDGADWENGSGYSSPAPGRTPLSTGGRATPPATMTPAALMEKEQEIRKMRELIAQREMSRKQKAMSRTNTATTVESHQREEEGSGANGSIIAPPQQNGFHPDGTTPSAVSDKRALTDAAVAGSASTSSSATPPIDSEDLSDQNGGPSASTNGAQGMSYLSLPFWPADCALPTNFLF